MGKSGVCRGCGLPMNGNPCKWGMHAQCVRAAGIPLMRNGAIDGMERARSNEVRRTFVAAGCVITHEIAALLARAAARVAERSVMQETDAPRKKKRPCLRCREDFMSEGAGNCVCGPCKGTRAWREGGGFAVRLPSTHRKGGAA